jgi:signal transduction protein with GAF and PtsI domain
LVDQQPTTKGESMAERERVTPMKLTSMVSTDALSRLKAVADELTAMSKIDDVYDVIVTNAVEGMGAVACGIVLLDARTNELVLVAGKNLPDTTIASFPLSLDTPVPITDAVTSGIPMWIEGARERDRWYPLLENDERSAPSQGMLPLHLDGRSVGVLGLTFDGSRSVGEIERNFCTILAGLCSLAIGRSGVLDALGE